MPISENLANNHTSGHIFFDTHAFVKKLIKVGFTEPQAEVLAEEQTELIENKLATKHDILLVQRDIENLRLETKKDMHALEEKLTYKLTIRMGGMLTVAVGVLSAMKYFA